MEWGLDQVMNKPTDGWKIKRLSKEDLKELHEVADLLEGLENSNSGTTIVRRKLDRLDTLDSPVIRERKLNNLVDSSRNHIELLSIDS